jgi:hypothetical protein
VEIHALTIDHLTERRDIYNYNRRGGEGKAIYFYRFCLYEPALKFPVFELLFWIAHVITLVSTMSGAVAS